tara:strand:+ start:14687 stop:14872 length:186 start_codon:yes stop_codon:yes gene_type:complete
MSLNSKGAQMNNAYINKFGRLECDGIEFHTGDVVDVYYNNKWVETRLEHSASKGGWYSIDI